MRLSVEFVTVGFLGICRQFCCDWFQVSWRADEVTPERGTPIIECWKTCQLELRPVLLGSPSTVVTRQFIRLPVTENIRQHINVVRTSSDTCWYVLYNIHRYLRLGESSIFFYYYCIYRLYDLGKKSVLLSYFFPAYIFGTWPVAGTTPLHNVGLKKWLCRHWTM